MSRKRPRTIAPVPLRVSHLRQGSLPQAETTLVGSGRRLAGVPSVTLSARLEPGRPGNSHHDSILQSYPVGWNTDFPSLPGRGAQDSSDEPQEPAIKLAIARSRCNGTYSIAVRLITRDEAVEQAINAHYICAIVTYLDVGTRRAWEKHRESLIEEKRDGYGNEGVTYFLSPGWMWVTAKQIFHTTRDCGLEVTVGDLVGGKVIRSDDFDDIRDIERSILFSVDRIAMSIEVGLSFDAGEQAIYAPGSTQKKGKPKIDNDGTPPDEWGN
jgi:hypothetical protein